MSDIAITFTDTTFTRADASERFDLLLGVEATIRLSVQGQAIYTEPMFPIVELRKALFDWLPGMQSDFSFISMESDQSGLIWFKRQSATSWRAGSVNEEIPATGEFRSAEIAMGCLAFIEQVDAWVQDELGVNAHTVLDGIR